MDAANLVLSAIAAFGAIVAGLRWYLNRPWHSIEVQLGDSPFFAHQGGGDRSMRMRAFGTSVLTNVDVHGVGCRVRPGHDGPPFPSLGPGETRVFSVDVSDGSIDEAWLYVNWTTPGSRHGRVHLEWLPLNHKGPLIRVRYEQLARGSLKNFFVGIAGGSTPSPLTTARGHAQAGPRAMASSTLSGRRGRKLSWWRVRLWKLLRIEEPSVKWAKPQTSDLDDH